MTLKDLKDEFDKELAKLSNQNIMDAFAEMGVVIEIDEAMSELETTTDTLQNLR